MMRSLRVTAIVWLAACSGDDSHKKSTMHAELPAPTPGGDAAPVAPPERPRPRAPPADRAMAMPYFATGDAAEGRQFGLENWRDARTAFTAARRRRPIQ
jgi:hypothetical protein